MDRIFEINRRSIFSLTEAQELLPVVLRITSQYSEQVAALMARLEALSGRREDLVSALEQQINSLITEWQNKILKLGGQPKGLWLADFDAGEGYFCWKFPERWVGFWRSYQDGFSKRCPVADRKSKVKRVLEHTNTN